MKRIIACITVVISILNACGDADVNNPTGSAEAPKQITITKIRNFQGGATVYFDRPDDLNFKYARAVYKPEAGKEERANASIYTDSLRLEGFKYAGEYQVDIYSVSFGETTSQPVSVIVNPLEPPYQGVVRTIGMAATFGGIKVSYNNPANAKLAVQVMKKDGNGVWKEIGRQYTDLSKGSYIVRGQESTPTEFGVVIRDNRYGYYSDTASTVTTPWYEIEFAKSGFKMHNLPGDTWEHHQSYGDPDALWDGTFDKFLHTKPDAFMPQHFTVDFGKPYYMSRFTLRPRSGNLYRVGDPRIFELYGSMNPNPDGTLFNPDGTLDDSWFLIGSYESLRLSGSTDPSNEVPLTELESKLYDTGIDYDAPEQLSQTPIRYIRFRTVKTWGLTPYMFMAEWWFYGDKVQ